MWNTIPLANPAPYLTFVASTSDLTPARKLLAGVCASHLWLRAPETDALTKLVVVSCSACLMQRICTVLLRFLIQSLQPGLLAKKATESGSLLRKVEITVSQNAEHWIGYITDTTYITTAASTLEKGDP